MSVKTKLTAPHLRESLVSFWDGALKVEPHGDGFIFTMPASYPDGWQIVLEISQLTPKGFRLSDRGQTLGWLKGQGQNVETDGMVRHIERLCREYRMQEEGGELHRWLDIPLEAAELQVFTEGLVSVSNLHLLHDPRATEEKVAEMVVNRVFHDAGLMPSRNHRLSITKERKVTVDYFVESSRPVAVELLKSKNDLTGKMERWGFRWDELRKNYRKLVPIMLYDRNTQMIDSYCRHIGEEKCDLFCGYDETDRIHEALEKAK